MILTFIGADHEVTGSCHYLEVNGKHILIDRGMQQGIDFFENIEIPISESMIDYVFLTHAHIDHSGMLPALVKNGFQGKIYATEATTDLCNIMLRDSAHIQVFESEWRNRKARRRGGKEVEPLYDMADADATVKLFESCPYNTEIEVEENLIIRFTDVGHLLGSSSIEVWATEQNVKKKIVFSGDIGNTDQPIIKDPQLTETADYVVMESTYGERYHDKSRVDYVSELAEMIQRTFDRGGNLVIPSFAVGRTQEILYFIRQIKADKRIKGHDNFPVYVDSPLAVEATEVFHDNIYSCFDEEAMELVREGINPLRFPGLKLSITSDESKAINFVHEPKVIISASGMCEAGRIRHHLKYNLWRPESTILFVGYQATGTVGRKILDGEDEVKLFGDYIEVSAEIESLEGLSGHADKEGLLNWINGFREKPDKVFVVHGDEGAADSFTACLNNEYGYSAYAPYSGTVYDLIANEIEYEARPIPIQKKKKFVSENIFTKLKIAGDRLRKVIKHNEGGANADLKKFTEEINDLCDKWDR
jgi:metallo-beta-lactamase family protein